jgi:hypothetical protein
MPFTSGVFANVAGAITATPGQTIQSAVWNNIHTDYATAFNQLMGQLLGLNTNRNSLWMNGGFEVWQRGAGISSSIAVGAGVTAYTADRWYLTTGANQASIVSAQTGLSDRSRASCRVIRNSGQTGTTAMVFGYPLDEDEIFRLRGNKVSLNLLARAGANWSPASGTLVVSLYVGTGAVAKRGGGFTGETQVLTVSTNLTAGGSAVAITGQSSGVVPTNSTQGELQFTWTPVGTAGAADNIDLDDIQLESVTSANTWTAFQYDRLDFPTMLQGCKRHYTKTFEYGTAPAAGGGLNNALTFYSQATARIGIFWQLSPEMRSNPTFLKFHPTTATSSNWLNFTAGATVSASIDTTNNAGATKGIFVYGLTAAAVDQFIYIHMSADAGI